MEERSDGDVVRYGFMRARRPMRVLVVDDVQDQAMILGILIKRMGHHVRLANDAPTALIRGDEEKPEVVFMDIGLPGMDGCGACRLMRQRPWGAGALMIAVTGRDEPADVERSLQAGFDHHVVKPMSFQFMRELLAKAEVKPRV